jgi:hypothetical protein
MWKNNFMLLKLRFYAISGKFFQKVDKSVEKMLASG